MRFLFTRRWLGLLLAVVVVGFGCVQLGLWQLDRYDERQDFNTTTRTNLAADPVAAAEVFSVTEEPSPKDEWRAVTATGSYDEEHRVLVLYRTKDGVPGVDVVVPLVTKSGAALMVDRGWVRTPGNANVDPDVPAPPPGTVTVTGWTRIDAEGDADEVVPVDGTVRAISADAIAETLPYDVYDGFVELISETPAVSPAPQQAEPPELGGGPHFFYGIQWFFFALLALAFWGYLAWSEHKQRNARSQPSVISTG